MAEKTIRVYDGVAYKEITGKEILVNNKPTGHYTRDSEKQITVYGQYLDSKANQTQLNKDIEELRSVNGYSSRNGRLTDHKNFNSFMLNYVRSNANKFEVNTWYDWVMDIILKLGYVNQQYAFDRNKKIIEFPISPKNGNGEVFILTLSAIDEDSYILD